MTPPNPTVNDTRSTGDIMRAALEPGYLSTKGFQPAPPERWPGYAQQTWQERFEELDRRTRELVAKDELMARLQAGERVGQKAKSEPYESSAEFMSGGDIFGHTGHVWPDSFVFPTFESIKKAMGKP